MDLGTDPRIRPGTVDDAPAVAALRAAAFPNNYVTAGEVRTWISTTPERARVLRWAVEQSGMLVGWATAGLNAETSEAHAGFGSTIVHPSYRRRGLGTSLWEEVEAHLGTLGVRHVSVFGADEDDTRRFMAARGFTVAFVDRTSGIDPSTLPPPPPPPERVVLRPFASIDDPQVVYELDVEAVRDVPLDQPRDDIRFDEWLERTWRFPELDRDCSVVAFVDGEPAGFTTLIIDPQTLLAGSGMTGVARRFRRQGLAELLKRHALAGAAAKGVTMALTDNDETNAPMLAVNTRLGYRQVATNLIFSRRR